MSLLLIMQARRRAALAVVILKTWLALREKAFHDYLSALVLDHVTGFCSCGYVWVDDLPPRCVGGLLYEHVGREFHDRVKAGTL